MSIFRNRDSGHAASAVDLSIRQAYDLRDLVRAARSAGVTSVDETYEHIVTAMRFKYPTWEPSCTRLHAQVASLIGD
jgi:hypothetical protein